MSASRPPTTNTTAMIITTSVMAAVLVLLGIGLIWLALQRGAQLFPVPTPTPTSGPTRTPTPNVQATYVAEDLLTQVASLATADGGATPVGATPGGIQPPVDQPVPVGTPLQSGAGDMTALLPLVIGANMTPLPPQAPGTPAAPAGTSVYAPNISSSQPTPPTPAPPTLPAPPDFTPTLDPSAPTPSPTASPISGGGEQPTATFTPAPPTPTFTPTSTFTPAPLTLSEMPATVTRGSGAPVHIGPSAVYTQVTTLGQGTQIRLRGRTPTGDWVYACCLGDNSSFWTRPAYISVDNTVLPIGAPTGADPKSLRWLALQPPDPALTPRPVPTAISPSDFPLARYDAANTGRVPSLPSGGLVNAWSNGNQGAGSFTSPVAVLGGATVLAANADGNFYGLYADGGNQRWRTPLTGEIRFAPAVQGNLIHVLNGAALATIQDQGGAGGLVRSTVLPAAPTAPVNVWLDTLLVGVGEGEDARLLAIWRDNLEDRRQFTDPVGPIRMPAVGQETIYVGANRLYAIDANLFAPNRPNVEIIWTSDPASIGAITLPPIYAYPGRRALAELYVSDGSRVHALDANTGAVIWTNDFGAEIKGLAVNEDNVFIVGDNQMRMVGREQNDQRWQVAVTAGLVGGPLVTDRVLLLVTQSGGLFLFNTTDGGTLGTISIPSGTGVTNGPAVSGLRIFAASGNSVYAFQGNP